MQHLEKQLKMNSRILLIAFVSLFIVTSNAQGIEFEQEKPFAQILEKAKAEGKLIFMDCFTTWCGPCKRLSAQTFPDPAVGAMFNAQFINVKMDMEKGEGPELSARFGVRAYPTLLWIDGNGNVKHRAMGYMEPEGLLAQARTATDQLVEKLAVLKEQYNSGKRDIPFLVEYVDLLQQSGSLTDSFFREFISKLSPEDYKIDNCLKAVYNATNHLLSPGIPLLLNNKAYLTKKMGEEVVKKKFSSIADKAINDAVIKKDEALFNGAIKFLKEVGSADADKKIAHARMDYNLRIKNLKEYEKYAGAYLKKYGAKDDKALNDVAWDFYIHVDDIKALEKAKKWAYSAVNVKNTVDNNTTYAYLNYKLKQYKEADLACDYALLKAKEEGVIAASASALKELLKKDYLQK
jgi:thiol-disulfide isomerase/thioredoxin